MKTVSKCVDPSMPMSTLNFPCAQQQTTRSGKNETGPSNSVSVVHITADIPNQSDLECSIHHFT